MRPALLGLGTAVPEHALPQAQIATWLARALERQPGAPDGFGRVVHRMAERAGVPLALSRQWFDRAFGTENTPTFARTA